MRVDAPLLDRFYDRIAYDRPDKCWEWMGTKDKDGYGDLRERRAHYKTHRLMWTEWHRRPIPAGQIVMHSCDNPPCLNPYHLMLGTRSQNARDMSAKGRAVRQKLLPVDIAEIKRLLADGERNVDIAKRFGVSAELICHVNRGRRG